MSAADAAYTMSYTTHEGEVSVPEPSAVGSMVFTYAICHFVVDLACVSTMLGAVSSTLDLAGTSNQPSPFAVFFAILREYEGEIPGARPEECGNWHDADLVQAQWWARRYLEKTLYCLDDAHTHYPALLS